MSYTCQFRNVPTNCPAFGFLSLSVIVTRYWDSLWSSAFPQSRRKRKSLKKPRGALRGTASEDTLSTRTLSKANESTIAPNNCACLVYTLLPINVHFNYGGMLRPNNSPALSHASHIPPTTQSFIMTSLFLFCPASKNLAVINFHVCNPCFQGRKHAAAEFKKKKCLVLLHGCNCNNGSLQVLLIQASICSSYSVQHVIGHL